jgi:hypothetical protein
MTDRKGFFALEAIPSGWWDETTQTIGWFSDDLLTDAAAGATVPLIEAADCTNSGNNTASTSWDLDRPAYSAGDLIVFCLCSDGGVTHDWPATGPDGETIVTLVDSEGGATTRSSVFYYIAGGAQSAGVLTVTPSATEQWTATVFRVPAGEFNATTPIETSAWDYPGSNNATPTLPALTAGPADGRVVGWFGVDTDDIDPPAPSGWSIITTVDRGAVGGTLVSRDAGTTAAESVASSVWSIPVAGRHTSISFIVNAPASGSVEEGAGSLSGEGTLAATGAATAEASAALSGTGTLAATGASFAEASASISAAGTLAAVGSGISEGAAALSGAGTLAATGETITVAEGAAALSGEGTLSATGAAIFAGAAAASGSADMAATGASEAASAASLSGAGSLAAVGSSFFAGAAALSGAGSIDVTGSAIASAIAAMAGEGTLSAVGGDAAATPASAAMSGAGSLDAVGVAITFFEGAATLSGTGSMSVRGLARRAPPTELFINGIEVAELYLGDLLIWAKP